MQWLNTKRFLFISFLSIVAGMSACEKVVVEADQSRAGTEYYPLAAGQYRIYDMYQINYNFATENDTLLFEVKDIIAEHYLNQEGDTTFVMQRLSREQPESSWRLDSLLHIRKTAFQAVELSNNIPLVKLVFPLSEGKTWDSNSLNASLADSFRMIDVNKPFLLNDSLINNTVTVLQRNIQDEIVRKDIRKEIYSKNIGPIYSIIQKINFCAEPDCIGQGIIISGIFQEMKLQSYGKE